MILLLLFSLNSVGIPALALLPIFILWAIWAYVGGFRCIWSVCIGQNTTFGKKLRLLDLTIAIITFMIFSGSLTFLLFDLYALF